MDAGAGDDAAVYRLDAERALVATVDFFTPIVDDPREFGRIAAANALSDLYAKGARPLFALNLIGFPRRHLGSGLLEEIVRGAGEMAALAGIPIIGGHSVDAPEPLFGLCAIGEVHPDRIIRNSSARPGDRLVLTKPLGTGVIATAIKHGTSPAEAITAATASMTRLNREASEAMLASDVHAATDVTGFGLLGHLHQMLGASGVAARLDASAIPLLPHAMRLAEAGEVPGGTLRNREDFGAYVEWSGAPVREPLRTLLWDAQTSGGLLIALSAEQAPSLLQRLGTAGPAAVIGEVEAGDAGRIRVVGATPADA